jgi:phage baseplate assembly protein W
MGDADRKTDFLGRGWGFPPAFDRRRGTVVMVEDDEDIRQSLQILFSTALRERVLLPHYGTSLQEHVFAPIEQSFLALLEDLIGKAILECEPRIRVENIHAAADPDHDGQVNIGIAYTVRTTNTRSNMVFPFYLAEGTLVRRIVQP